MNNSQEWRRTHKKGKGWQETQQQEKPRTEATRKHTKSGKSHQLQGPNLIAANQRGEPVLYIMMGPEGHRRLKQELPYVEIEEDDAYSGDIRHFVEIAFPKRRNTIVASVGAETVGTFSARDKNRDAQRRARYIDSVCRARGRRGQTACGLINYK